MNEIQISDASLNSDFVKTILSESRQNINICYQCKKCTAGCPLVSEMDYTPTQIIHAIRFGIKDIVLNSKTIWLCASCETCTTRCPQELDIAKVMDALRIIALKSGIKPHVSEIPAFYSSALDSVRLFGRMYELGMLILLKMRTREFGKDIGLGIKMLKKGKIKLIPDIASVLEVNRIFSRIRKREKKSI